MDRPIAPHDQSSTRGLRAALLAGATTTTTAVQPRLEQAEVPDRSIVPTATELLEASPNIRRLCESYHRTQRQMVDRSRRQRLGLALLVAGVGVGAIIAGRDGSLSATTLHSAVLAVGLSACIALGVLALLWMRDVRRLRDVQGERLLRALQFSCSLPELRVVALRRVGDPTHAFFGCYDAWLVENPQRRGGLAGLLASAQPRHKAAA